jgi:PAS domain S-box-containing protein
MKDVPPVNRVLGFPRLKTFIDKPLRFRYITPILLIVIISFGRGYIQSVLPARGTYLPLYAAVLYSAWAFGSRQAMLSMIIAGFGANFLYVKPDWIFNVTSVSDLIMLFAFWAVGLFSIYLVELQRRYAQHLEAEIQQRRQAEANLVQSEERFRMATATLQGGIYNWDRTVDQVWRSPGFFQLIGYQPAEIPLDFDWWLGQLHPDDRQRIQQELDSLNAQRRIGRVMEYRVRHKDGHYIWVLDTSRVAYNPDGSYARVSGLTVSIDNQKRSEARNQSLLDFATQLSSTLTTREVVNIVAQTALTAVGGDTIGIFQLSKDSRILERLSIIGLDERFFDHYPALRLDANYAIAESIRDKKVLSFETQQEYIRHYPHLEAEIKHVEHHAIICLPFFVNDHLLGGMYIAFARPRSFEVDERSFLFLMAQLCGQALERVNLYEAEHQARKEAERKSTRIEALQSITANFSAAATAQEVLQVIVNQAFHILNAHMGAVTLLSDDRSGVQIVAQFAVNKPLLTEYQFIPFARQTPISDVAQTRQPIWIRSLEEYEQLYPEISKAVHLRTGTQAIACLPLIIHDKLIGSLGMSFPTPQNFNAEDRDYLTALAQQSAQALVRAKLSEQAKEMAVVQERQRLARELHDGATQSIFTANILIETLPRIWQRSPEKALGLVEQVHQLTQGAGSEMRMLLYEFRPENIIKASLVDLINHLVRGLKNRKVIDITFNITGDQTQTLPEKAHITFYRIAQEGLNNIAKHGRATHIHMRLRYTKAYVALVIHDDGQGFDTKKISSGFGLNSMRERAEDIGASLNICSQIGQGTKIALLWKRPAEDSSP